jgi:NAD-dependent SIR2 family protein deacetylase
MALHGVTGVPRVAGSFSQVKMCSHCGEQQAERIGYCAECGMPVCSKCGNSQITLTERTVLHDSCLKYGEGDRFSMIKFVK